MSTIVVDNIGLLVTNDESAGEGQLDVRRNAAVVIEGESILEVTDAGVTADECIDAGGRCVIPGFVDSHTHLLFAGDRSAEFAARMAGTPYAAAGIMSTVSATRAASDAELRSGMERRFREALSGGTTTVEIKSGYGLTADDEERSLRIARGITAETTFLGAHLVPAEYAGRSDAYVEYVCSTMLNRCVNHARWIDAFCEKGAFSADQCRVVLEAGKKAGLAGRLHANQLGHGPGVQLAVEMGCASADHCTYLSDADVEALAASDTVATFLPASDFSTRHAYPDARRVIDAGARVAIATNCNPGSSYTTSMAFCMALAVREMRMTIEEALRAATSGGAFALRRKDVGCIKKGNRADLAILDAPSYVHLVYRPGVPLVRTVLHGGVVVTANGLRA